MRRGHVAVRTCLGCLKKYPKDKLVRFVCGPGGVVLGSAEGRGSYICSEGCLVRALGAKGRKGLSGLGPDRPDLVSLREAVARLQGGPRAASGGGAIG